MSTTGVAGHKPPRTRKPYARYPGEPEFDVRYRSNFATDEAWSEAMAAARALEQRGLTRRAARMRLNLDGVR